MTKPFEVFFASGNDGYSGDFRRFVRVCLLDGFLKLLVQAFSLLIRQSHSSAVSFLFFHQYVLCIGPIIWTQPASLFCTRVRATFSASSLLPVVVKIWTYCFILVRLVFCFLNSVWFQEALEFFAGHSIAFLARFSNMEGNVFQLGRSVQTSQRVVFSCSSG